MDNQKLKAILKVKYGKQKPEDFQKLVVDEKYMIDKKAKEKMEAQAAEADPMDQVDPSLPDEERLKEIMKILGKFGK